MSYTPRQRTDFIAIHCTATKPNQNVDEAEIRKWHTDKGWQDIGYNIVIPRDGSIQIGRPMDYQGAHVEGYNSRSLGICLVGGIDEDGFPAANYTAKQWEALLIAVKFCKLYAPNAKVQGHRDFPNVVKDCPCFDVREWLEATAKELM